MKKLIAVLLILMLAAGCAGCAKQAETGAEEPSSPAAEGQAGAAAQEGNPSSVTVLAAVRLEGSGYASPEDAVTAYIEAMNRGDANGMLSTFAIETYVENADPALLLQYNSAVSIASAWKTIPCTDPFVKSLVTANRYSYLSSYLISAYIVYGLGEDTSVQLVKTAGERQALAEQFHRSPMHDMAGHVEFVRWLNPVNLSDGLIVTPGTGGDTIADQAYTGADDITELVAELRISGKRAFQPMRCARYGDRWYNLDFITKTINLAGGRSFWQQYLWFLSDESEEAARIDQQLAADYPAENARWDALQQSGRGGSRWPLGSLSMPGVTVHGTAEAAENDSGLGIWAEIHFIRMGGAMITIRVSPALQERLGMNSSVTRIYFSWFADEIPLIRTMKSVLTGKTVSMPLIRFYGNPKEEPFSLEYLSVAQDDTSITFSLGDGTTAVFEKPAASAAAPSTEESAAPAARLEGDGYGTPEEAVLAYLDALNRGDVRSMLSVFALETYAKHADPMFSIERLGTYAFNKNYYIPYSDDYGCSMLAYSRAGFITSGLLSALISFAGDFTQNFRLETDDDIENYLNQFDSSPLKDLPGNVSFTGWINPVSMSRGYLTNKQTAGARMADLVLSGADDQAIRVAEFQVNGHKAYLPMRCIRYEDRWYLDYPASSIIFQYNIPTNRLFFWMPSAEEQAEIDQVLSQDYSEETARWEAVTRSGLGGTCWQLVSVSAPDVTVCDSADTAENAGGKALRAEMRLDSTGSGVITLTSSSPLQQARGADSAVSRVFFAWEPAASGSLELGPFYEFLQSGNTANSDTVTASLDGSELAVTFPDGTQAVFRKTGE